MCENKEENLWEILISIFDGDYILSSPKYIAGLCYDAGFKNIDHIKYVFFNEVFPVCILPVLFDVFNQPIDEEKLIIAIKKYKKNIFSQFLLKILLAFISKKNIYHFFDQFAVELEILKNNN